MFAITGQLMRHYYHNTEAPDVERLYRRSRHLFLLLAGLTQGGIGIYIQPYSSRLLSHLQWLATGLMSLASAFLIYAFFYEIPPVIIRGHFSRLAMYLLLASVVLHFGASIVNGYYESKNNPPKN
jgi:uncharacterized membrane protein YoaK (UPF0700 family)